MGLFIIAITPWHIIMSRWGFHGNIAPSFLLISFYFYIKSFNKIPYIYISMIFFALTLYTYDPIIGYIGLSLPFLIIYSFFTTANTTNKIHIILNDKSYMKADNASFYGKDYYEMDDVEYSPCYQCVMNDKLTWKIRAKKIEQKDAESKKLMKYFQVVIGGDMVKRSKPQPDIFLKACEELGVEPEEAFAIEDSYNGIRAAAAGKLRPLMVPDLMPPTEEMQELSEEIFETLLDVKDYLERKTL